jgi:hypothetical protein
MPDGAPDTDYLVRILPAADAKTGAKRGGDWKELAFYETFENLPLGMKFFFNNNVWLVFNTDDYSPAITTAVVRRCNSALKRPDAFGNIHAEPCVWDKDIPMQSKIIYRGSNNVFNPELNLYAQYNAFTKTIKTDDRFLFGVGEAAQAFKIKEPVDFVLGETFNAGSAQLILFSLERTLVSKSLDDVENGVANRFAASAAAKADGAAIRLTPNVAQIDRFEKTTFTASGADAFVFSFADVPESCFEVTNVTQNSFDLTCLLPYDKKPLKIIAATENDAAVFSIWLRSGL